MLTFSLLFHNFLQLKQKYIACIRSIHFYLNKTHPCLIHISASKLPSTRFCMWKTHFIAMNMYVINLFKKKKKTFLKLNGMPTILICVFSNVKNNGEMDSTLYVYLVLSNFIGKFCGWIKGAFGKFHADYYLKCINKMFNPYWCFYSLIHMHISAIIHIEVKLWRHYH